jgi:Cdc6-like AAA superfamily ATPase
MVDINAYKILHRSQKVTDEVLRENIRPQKMDGDQPPEGDSLLVFEPYIRAYNLQEKSWKELFVDRITDIVWNKQAFQDLVADAGTKELVKALVMKQLSSTHSTDFVTGKGNGLIMLLHGAPGTGKTFTAEGVAEFAEKPLLRVTCGDIGTHAEVVDKRLRATFKLGKMWDCGMANCSFIMKCAKPR